MCRESPYWCICHQSKSECLAKGGPDRQLLTWTP